MEILPASKMDAAAWDRLAASFPLAHVLQTWEWGQAKVRNGWKPLYLVWKQAGEVQPRAAAQVLQRRVGAGGFAAQLSVMYAPKGPLLADWADDDLRESVLRGLQQAARQAGAIFIKIDPDLALGWGTPGGEGSKENPLGEQVIDHLRAAGWRFSPEQVQFRNTALVDLQADEADMLARMKQKTRYNIRLAERKRVRVRRGRAEDVALLYEMYRETARRDGFVIREGGYYRDLWGAFIEEGERGDGKGTAEGGERGKEGKTDVVTTMGEGEGSRWDVKRPGAEALIAEVEGEAAAGVILFHFARRAWYMFGMSRDIHREKMPNALLQWEAMRRAREAGCEVYDLWGAPDEFVESDPLWGVYRFKEGLGGYVERRIGAWDYPVRPFYYRMYTEILPRILAWMRSKAR
ncbi:MAG: peptidoglycan bridge formation glycyltransferase FemA/FemB family protein [Chloroflexi bacterium]|nr:peptidoglycan bridge formation glycyltransferase FemA/FemB family protein [Chloroflexota bacterium]